MKQTIGLWIMLLTTVPLLFVAAVALLATAPWWVIIWMLVFLTGCGLMLADY
jgi:hypothetical protein